LYLVVAIEADEKDSSQSLQPIQEKVECCTERVVLPLPANSSFGSRGIAHNACLIDRSIMIV
jgi:hypothetical protein